MSWVCEKKCESFKSIFSWYFVWHKTHPSINGFLQRNFVRANVQISFIFGLNTILMLICLIAERCITHHEFSFYIYPRFSSKFLSRNYDTIFCKKIIANMERKWKMIALHILCDNVGDLKENKIYINTRMVSVYAINSCWDKYTNYINK